MDRRLTTATFVAAMGIVALAVPAFAHGDHDARPLARQLEAGPYRISLWQVYPDAGTSVTPRLIVLFDAGTAAPAAAEVVVVVNSISVEVQPSPTTANGWETTTGIAAGDVVSVTISDGSQTWALDPVVVPMAPTSTLPMRELIYVSIVLTAATAAWAVARTARAWRPAMRPG